MKVLLVDPGKVSESWYSTRQCPNLGLAYIASNLYADGHSVRVLDMATYGLRLNEYVDILLEYSPDFLGISAASFNILDAYELAWITKKMSQDVFTILGGAHCSALPQKTLNECKYIDAVVVGEGERVILDLVTRNPKPGVHIGEPIIDLGKIRFPRWDMYDYSKYSKAFSIHFNERKHIYPIVSSRGCIHNRCKFCYQLHGRGVRFRSPTSFVDEIEHNYIKYGADFWYFADSNFSPSKKHLIEVCDEITSRELPISFKCQTRVDLATKEVLSKMDEAGCELVFYGIESGDQNILTRSGKNITLDQVRKAVKNASDIGLTVRGSFILGLDGDTQLSVLKTINFARELKKIGLDQAQFHCLDLYPGTDYWKMALVGDGSLRPTYDLYDWSVFSREEAHVETNDLTVEDLNRLKRELEV